ncbi:MAG: tRNA (adenosine(37)-N6)-threonylcarbamoyltransferase complex ATPase subunit type 1 TsaE [Calditrichaeota bacterium]|nr:tRNA (adenosine(37)-N6)-threonylcarbamoyltransferase complex ATPase subunit type 1 TsaE [Calditrichota bacterium]
MISVSHLNEMEQFARSIAQTVRAGDVILLSGDLGAGKTTFVQFLCKYLGVQDTVNSPTFSLLNIYDSDNFPIYHYDFYRMNTADELEQIGFFESIDSQHFVIIEWALKFPESLPDSSKLLSFSTDGTQRTVEESTWFSDQLQKK